MKENLTRRSGYVAIDGDQLYYEVQGTGQPLLLIPGGNGDSWWLHKIASVLAKTFKVITYDLRGTARSIISKPLNIEMNRQSSDAVAVINALGEKAADVVGISSGAIIGLDLIAQFPQHIKSLVAFEPPLIRIHPSNKQLHKMVAKVYSTAFNWGATLASLRFALGARLPFKPMLKGAGEFKQYLAETTTPRMHASTADEFLELVMMTNYLPDTEKIKSSGIPIYTGAGIESLKNKCFYAQNAFILAKSLNGKMAKFPGHHFSFFHDPEGCAQVICDILLKKQ